MTDVDKALADIAEMRERVAQSLEFRGYGPQALAATAILAGAAGFTQIFLIPTPDSEPFAYFALWTFVAGFAIVIIGVEAARRVATEHGGLGGEMLLSAARRFAPAGLAGLLTSLVILRHAPEAAWMLPGLWQIMLSLGVFAAAHSLPRAMILVAAWYLSTGLACLVYAAGPHAFTPFAMALPFCGGQILAAVVMRLSRGGDHDEE
ncbi:hypothetical protein MSC49_31520 [Methylosinus sp. C49]|uniref:hypothetical protein n=1 Tax=Methylosinus sp. C49 TaxID=2699395 RepID=UPI001366CAA9|nr:hypothetical protein [Methylosinus sp. C49]BBU63217.1 hypothetical protein MSC49_31520 [Methylosinus sp. C49]